MLRAAGCHVLHATTVVDALDVLRGEGAVHLLIASVIIADQPTGFTLARMARLRRPDLPVVYLANRPIADSERERALGPIIDIQTTTADAFVEQVLSTIDGRTVEKASIPSR